MAVVLMPFCCEMLPLNIYGECLCAVGRSAVCMCVCVCVQKAFKHILSTTYCNPALTLRPLVQLFLHEAKN